MRKIVHRLRNFFKLVAFSACGTLVVAALVALRHVINTPQPLESVLPGEAHIFRWKLGNIFYKTLGDENAFPLVLFHTPAFGASSFEMRKIIEPLAQKYHVYAPDLPGFGLSDHPDINYSPEVYVDFCHDFLNTVVAQPAKILAGGLACNYSVIVAQRYPEICSELILISPIELFGSNRLQSLASLLQLPAVRFLLYPLFSTRASLRYLLSWRYHTPQAQISESDVNYVYATTHQFGAESAPMALLAGKLSVDASQEFDSLHQPALILWGARALNNAWSIASKHLLPGHAALVLIQDAGLFAHEEYPAMVVANIQDWSEERTTKEQADSIQTPATVEAEQATDIAALEAYCVKCKKKTLMQDAHEVTMKNGSPAVKGRCSICGTGQHRIGKLEKELT